MASPDPSRLAAAVLEFFNTVTDPYEIRYRIKDDPNFRASGYGISRSVAEHILAVRDGQPDGRFTSIRQIDDTEGVGLVTLHNILYSFQVPEQFRAAKIAHGRTTPGSTDWQTYPAGSPQSASLVVDVDSSDAGFESEPLYFTSIGGLGNHWVLTGTSAIYPLMDADDNPLPLRSGFRMYIMHPGESLTPDFANKREWHINWMGIAD